MSRDLEQLVVRDADGSELARLAVVDYGEGTHDRACPCGGRLILGWVLDVDTAKPIPTMPFMLHTDPPCAPFQRTEFRDYWTYTRTGEIADRAPIVRTVPKPETPRKATHR